MVEEQEDVGDGVLKRFLECGRGDGVRDRDITHNESKNVVCGIKTRASSCKLILVGNFFVDVHQKNKFDLLFFFTQTFFRVRVRVFPHLHYKRNLLTNPKLNHFPRRNFVVGLPWELFESYNHLHLLTNTMKTIGLSGIPANSH